MRRGPKTGTDRRRNNAHFRLRLGKPVSLFVSKECVSKIGLSKLDRAWVFVKLDKRQTLEGK
jgi:hypothetical protein